jgi:DNA replication protein DnaC
MQTTDQIINLALRQANSETLNALRPPESQTQQRSEGDCKPVRTVEKPLPTPWQATCLKLKDRGQDVRNMALAAERWARRFYRQERIGRHLILAGNVGTGKTHTASQLYRWASAARLTVMSINRLSTAPRIEWCQWSDISDLSDDMFRTWKEDRFETDCLFLEDIGAEVDRYGKGIPAERLRRILEDFKSKFMVLTTNLFLDEWKTKWDHRVEDRLFRGESVIVEIRNLHSYAKDEI